MKRHAVGFGVTLALLLMLTGCASLAEKRATELSVLAHGNISQMVRVTVLYPSAAQQQNIAEEGLYKGKMPEPESRVAAGKVEVYDDLGRVRLTTQLNEQGQTLFRYPERATYIDIVVTAPNGMQGRTKVDMSEVRPDRNCQVPPC